MDLTEAFAPGGGGGGNSSGITQDVEKTDFLDLFVSPQSLSSAQGSQSATPSHCTLIESISNDEAILRSTHNCRALDFLHDRQSRMEDTERELTFIKETNNNTLTALPPVSTITSSLSQHSRNNNCDNIQNDSMSMEHSDCDYWSAVGDNKETACNILLEDLNKYCWSSHHTDCHHSLVGHQSADTSIEMHQVGDSVSTACNDNGRQNTDGAIYTLTVLNNETDSMDALECCKSPVPTVSDSSWSLRPNLDLDAILSLEPTTADQQDHESIGIDTSASSFHTISSHHSNTHFSADEGNFVESKIEENRRLQPSALGDNNNDWKLSDQNHLNETTIATVSATGVDSGESLLKSALQGKLYTTCSATPVLVSSSSSSSSSLANSSISLTSSSCTNTSNALHLLTDQHHHLHQQQQDYIKEEKVSTDEDPILSSHLDTPSYRPGEYEKLASIASEVVESYCSLEPVCNVAATTVMYTLDPSSGNLGTITLPADLSQVGTVTVVTASSLAAQQEMILEQTVSNRSDICESIQQQVTSNQMCNTRVTTTTTSSSSSSNTNCTRKSGKKYCRRKNNNTNNSNTGGTTNSSSSLSISSSNNSINSSSGNNNNNSNQQQSGQPSGSPSSGVQRKERSLHYCSICSKGFKDKYSVNVHIRTHTGEKPFACSLCGKSFRQKAHLAKHYQTHVAQKPNVASTNNNASTSTTSNNNNNSNSSNNNNSSADMTSGRTPPQLVATITASCNPTCN